jgi:protein O-mannosyl-transferase
VESVAWITERKNVLSGFFYLASMVAFLRFAGGSEIPQSASRRDAAFYVLGFVLFLMALLSKTVAVTLPVALLFGLYRRADRVRQRDVLTVLPLLLIGLPFGLMTVHLERTHVGATGPWWDFSLLERMLIAGQAFWFYIMKIAVPYPLVFVYPKWAVQTGSIVVWLYPITAVGAVQLALWYRRGVAMAGLAACCSDR